MLLENKNAVIYGAGGAIGAAVARAFARDGAKVDRVGLNQAAERSRLTRVGSARPRPPEDHAASWITSIAGCAPLTLQA
jgi:NAD(P)-dependent dehydrogenase (short-subunit alcohol dehydrogenase family)